MTPPGISWPEVRGEVAEAKKEQVLLMSWVLKRRRVEVKEERRGRESVEKVPVMEAEPVRVVRAGRVRAEERRVLFAIVRAAVEEVDDEDDMEDVLVVVLEEVPEMVWRIGTLRVASCELPMMARLSAVTRDGRFRVDRVVPVMLIAPPLSRLPRSRDEICVMARESEIVVTLERFTLGMAEFCIIVKLLTEPDNDDRSICSSTRFMVIVRLSSVVGWNDGPPRDSMKLFEKVTFPGPS